MGRNQDKWGGHRNNKTQVAAVDLKTQPSCYCMCFPKASIKIISVDVVRILCFLEVYISDDLVDVKTMFLSAHLERVRFCYYRCYWVGW